MELPPRPPACRKGLRVDGKQEINLEWPKMIWLLVSVLCDSKCVGPNWVETQEQFTLADLLEQVTGGKYLEASTMKNS